MACPCCVPAFRARAVAVRTLYVGSSVATLGLEQLQCFQVHCCTVDIVCDSDMAQPGGGSANPQQLMQAIQRLQQGQSRLQEQVQQSLTENRQIRDANTASSQRLHQAESDFRPVVAVRQERTESMEVLRVIPEALKSIGGQKERKNLFDSKGLGKPQTLGDEQAEQRFRLWSIKREDYVAGVFGEKCREAMQWASESEGEITEALLANTYGEHAESSDSIDDVDDMNTKLYSALRSTTEGTPFDVVDNTSSNSGLEAWRLLHRKYDPATGGRKRVSHHSG